MRSLAATLVLFGALCSVARADVKCPRLTAHLASKADVVDQINESALRNFRLAAFNEVPPSWFPVSSPVTDWYLCTAIALGKPENSRIGSGAGILRFTDSAASHVGLSSAAWVDRSRAKLTPEIETVLTQQMGTKVFPIGDTPISFSNREFAPMESWLSKGSLGLPDAAGFVSDLGLLALGGDDARLGIAFVYSIGGAAKFDNVLNSWPNSLSTVPFFGGNDVQGVRLDSSSQRLSLYVFSGSEHALGLFRATLNNAEWKRIQMQFVKRQVHFVASTFMLNARRSFDALDDYTSYGVKVQTPQDYYSARTQSRFALTNEGFSFAAISGEEGMTNLHFLMRDPAAIRAVHPLSTLSPVFFVVEDMDSHVILLLGMTAPDSASTE